MGAGPWQPQLLVVEDSQVRQAWLEDWLKDRGLRFRIAANGLAALRMLEGLLVDEPPDLIVTDFHMPEMNGIQLIRELRSRDEFEEIPVLLYTSRWAEAETFSQELGTQDLLEGAVDFECLPQAIEQAIASLYAVRVLAQRASG